LLPLPIAGAAIVGALSNPPPDPTLPSGPPAAAPPSNPIGNPVMPLPPTNPSTPPEDNLPPPVPPPGNTNTPPAQNSPPRVIVKEAFIATTVPTFPAFSVGLALGMGLSRFL
jgi:hypothetical protein